LFEKTAIIPRLFRFHAPNETIKPEDCTLQNQKLLNFPPACYFRLLKIHRLTASRNKNRNTTAKTV